MEQEKMNAAAKAGAEQPQSTPSVHYHYYGPQYPAAWYYSPKECCPKPHRSSKPGVAGTLLIIAGVLAIVLGSLMGSFSVGVGPMWNMMDNGANSANNELVNVQGQVIFMNSTPAVGANITIVDLGIMASTNSTGQFKILNVKVGWHDLKVELPGYKAIIQSVEVTKGMMGMNQGHNMVWNDYVAVDFQLQPGSGEVRIGDAHEQGPLSSDWETNGKPFMQNFGAICLVASVIAGAFMITGGYYAIKRTKLPLVVVGSVFAMVFCSILGIIAIILVLMSTNEFDRKHKHKEDDDGKGHTGGGQGGQPEPPRPVSEKKPELNAPTTKGPEKISPAYVGGQFPAMAYTPYPGPQYYPYPRQY